MYHLRVKIWNAACLSLALSMMVTMYGFSWPSVQSSPCHCSNEVVMEVESSCCSQQSEVETDCCCDPQSKRCACEDCSCSESDDTPPLPAIPASQSSDLVYVSLPSLNTGFELPWPPTVTNKGFEHSAFFSNPLTAQQTCAVLSRFTC